MKNILFIIILAAMTACCPCRHLMTSTGTRDSLHIEVRHRTIWIPDTVRVQLPAERTEQTVRQDSSHLETSAAVSDARINPDGSLTHSLENKPDEQNIPTQRPIEQRDSIVYRDRNVTVEKIVEVERKLTWWQQTKMRGFWVLLAVVVFICRKNILSLARRLIQFISR